MTTKNIRESLAKYGIDSVAISKHSNGLEEEFFCKTPDEKPYYFVICHSGTPMSLIAGLEKHLSAILSNSKSARETNIALQLNDALDDIISPH